MKPYGSRGVLNSYTIHCLFSKNNTHFTICSKWEPATSLAATNTTYDDKFGEWINMKSLVEYKISTGPLGFRKANRGEYEAGFQTASQCLKEMAEIVKRSSNNKYNGSLVPIDIRMKEFGKGRSAFIAALNGKEGNRVRSLVRQISDCTALKFGGVRSPGQRRL